MFCCNHVPAATVSCCAQSENGENALRDFLGEHAIARAPKRDAQHHAEVFFDERRERVLGGGDAKAPQQDFIRSAIGPMLHRCHSVHLITVVRS